MKHLYIVENEKQLNNLKKYTQEITPLFDKYLTHLKENYKVDELPRAIIWTDYETATNFISDIPLPAYTNDYRTVMVPDIEVWKNLYLKQLDKYEETKETLKVREYYEKLGNHNILQILGHEMAHHSELFFDETYEKEMWFEEGMVEYISRKFFLTEEEYAAEKEINQMLVTLYDNQYGHLSLNEFSQFTYGQEIVHVLYAYWRSFLMIDTLAEKCNGNISDIFHSYHLWYQGGEKGTLLNFFLSFSKGTSAGSYFYL